MEPIKSIVTCRPVSSPVAWLIWLSLSLFYFYEYYLRTAPSVMLPELVDYFQIDRTGLGSLVGAYYYSYAPMQVIAGVLLDRFGGKKTLPWGVLMCALGSFLFIKPSLYCAYVGRLLIGAGSGFAFVGVIFIATNWIPKKHLALLTGLTQTVGMLGAVFGQILVSYVLVHYGSVWVWHTASIAGLALSMLIWWIIPTRPTEAVATLKAIGFSQVRAKSWKVISNPQTWYCGLFGGLIFLPTAVFAMLWAIPFFMSAYQYTIEEAVHLTSSLMIGWAVGAPLTGFISDRVGRRKPVMLAGLLSVLFAFLAVVYYPHLRYWQLLVAMAIIGLGSGVELIAIALSCELNSRYAKGSAIGITNFVVFLCSAIMAPLLGFVLVILGSSHSATPNLVSEYQGAMSLIPAGLIAAAIFLYFTRESHTQQTE